MSEISPGVQPISTKLWNAVIANALDGKLQVWSDEAITTPRTLLQDIDLTGITVPTYLLYGIDDQTCPAAENMALLDTFSAKKRFEYDNFNHLSFYISDPKITADVIVILGSGASSLHALAMTITFFSLNY